MLLNMNSCNDYLIKDLKLKAKWDSTQLSRVLVKQRTHDSLFTYECSFFNNLRYVLEADDNHI